MQVNAAMFLFFAATIVSVFAFLSVAVWVATPSQERKERQRLELLKTIAEQKTENAAVVLEMLRAEDRERAARRRDEQRRGYILGGLITFAVGTGLQTFLLMTTPGNYWTVALIPSLVGLVLIGAGLRLPRGGGPA